jgi:hypothetical protein
MVLFVPIARDLLVVVVEFGVLLAILIVSILILPAILCENSVTSKRNKRYHTSNCPHTYLQKFLPITSKSVPSTIG